MDVKNIASNFYPAYTWFWNNTITCEGIDRQIDEMYENGIPKPITNTGDAYTVDGVHPNDNGYQLIAEKICEHLKKTFIY